MDSGTVKEIYENTAEDYDKWVIPCKLCQYQMLIQSLNLRGDERILDIGCGPGELTRKIAENLEEGDVTGIDISENMIDLARKKSKERDIENVQFKAGDYQEISLEKNYDVCVSSYLFHWMSDPKDFLIWVQNTLNENGKIGLLVPSPDWYRDVQEAYEKAMKKFEFSPEELVGTNLVTKEKIHEYFGTTNFELVTFSEFSFQEKTELESCLKRIDAKSDRKYFQGIPEGQRKQV